MKSDLFQERVFEKDIVSIVILVLFKKEPLQRRIMKRFEFCYDRSAKRAFLDMWTTRFPVPATHSGTRDGAGVRERMRRLAL